MTLKKALKDISKTVTTGLLATYLALSPAYANETQSTDQEDTQEELEFKPILKGYIELNPGHKSTTLDTRLMFGPAPRMKIFNRNRITSDHEGNISTSHYLSVNGEPAKGLSIGGGFWGSNAGGIRPHIAQHYSGNWGDFSLSQLLSVTIEENPKCMPLVNLNYHPTIAENWRFISELEAVTILESNDGKPEHVLSTQRFRVGFGYKNFQFGAAVDLIERGNEGDFEYVIGGNGRITLP